MAVAAVLAAALVAACAPPPPAAPTPLPGEGTDPGRPEVGEQQVPTCAAARMRSCALPYPSDEFTVADPTTGSGRRVQMPEEVLPAVLRDQLGPGAGIADAFDGADGFASLSPVTFELDRGIDAASLPADGGDAVRAYDVATGQAVPLRVELLADAARLGAAGTIVVAWPQVRWEPGRAYVVRLSTSVTSPHGPVRRAPGVEAATDPYLRSVRDDLARIEGDRWDEVVQATRFTVRSSADATAELDAMAAAVRAADHPVRNLEVGPPLLVDHAAAVVRGEVLVSDFRDDDGVLRPHQPPRPSWERFMLVVPETPAGPDGAPVVVYGHGLSISKESLLLVASTNAERGLATISIDVPNHGERIDEGGGLLDLVRIDRFGRLVAMPAQGVVDHLSLIAGVRDHLAGADLGPWYLGAPAGDGVADLDTTRLLYQGTSMGGVLGASVMALAPELDAGYLQVAGTGIADIIFHSVLWAMFVHVLPVGVSAGDSAALMSAATMLMDTVDNVNVLDRLREGDRPLFVQYGVGDEIVPNVNTERMAALLGLPVVGEQLAPWRLGVPMGPAAVGDTAGWGLFQVDFSELGGEVAQPLAGHVSFLDPDAIANMEDWLDGRLRALGLDGGPVTGS